MAHGFKSEENCIKCCWFYLNFSVNYFLVGRHCGDVNEDSTPGSMDGVSAHSYTIRAEEKLIFLFAALYWPGICVSLEEFVCFGFFLRLLLCLVTTCHNRAYFRKQPVLFSSSL